MAEINLRHYVQEIDDLIEEGEQLEMAIAHCRHILKSFPKHIDTYRLLGKAYLESKRYGDAADIFQRVLSAIPDDFVSHVGMAIIREDEGNIDSSIWHMERAAEAKPGNPAIEQEIKRLIGKRDGLEPQRVRPSRGALARMYSHGELFSYATTELKRALEEDPDRPDLQVLLANTFWLTDQRIDAAKLCSKILEKLPYCRDANRITAALLIESGKTQEANSYMRRLISLDPYIANLRSPMDESHSVEASAVQIERLSWTPGQAMPTSEDDQPDWAASLGVDLHGESDTPVEEEVPTWLKPPEDLSEEEEVPQEPEPTIHPFAGAEPPPGADIPDWMRDAGWVGSDGTATEGPMEAPEEEMPGVSEVVEDEPIAPAEFPDWLTDISTSELRAEGFAPDVEEKAGEEQPGDETLDWITAEPEAIESESISESDFPRFEEAADELVPDLEQFIPEMDTSDSFEELIEKAVEEDPAPDEPVSEPGEAGFFEQEGLIPPGTQELPPWLEDDAPGASETIVTWLGDKSKGDAAPLSEDIPSWMRGTGPLIDLPDEYKQDPQPTFEVGEPTEAPSIEEASESEDSETEDMGAQLFEEAAPASIDEFISQPDEVAEVLETEPAELEAELEQVGEADTDETPGWLQEIADIEDDQLPAEPVAEASPDWIKELPDTEEQVPSAQASEDAPEWLSEEDGPKQPPVLEELAEGEPTPEWLEEVIQKDVSAVEKAAAADAVADAVAEEQPDWLLEIAETEGEETAEAVDTEADEPEWLTAVELPEGEVLEEEVEEKPPEWVQTLTDEEIGEVEITPEEEEPPEWISELIPPEDLETGEAEEEEPPEWVKTGVYDRPEPEVLEIEDDVAADDEVPVVSDVEGVSEVAEAPVVAEADVVGEAEPALEESVVDEDAPDWLVDISSTDAVEPVDAQPDESPAWLHEVEIDEIEAAITPGMEDLAVEEPTAAVDEVVDQDEPRAVWKPEFDESVLEEEPEPDTAELEAAEKEIESRLVWLQESAQAVAPEPDVPVVEEGVVEQDVEDSAVEPMVTEAEIEEEIAEALSGLDAVEVEDEIVIEISEEAPPVAEEPETEAVIEAEVEEAVAAIEGLGESIDVEIDDEEVSSFLEDLAKTEAVDEGAETPEATSTQLSADPAIEQVEIPEDVEGGLEWLEQLATEDQVEEVVSPELPITLEEDADAEVPDWLQEVAEHAEEFSDDDAEVEMLETLEELEIEEVEEVAEVEDLEVPEPVFDVDPSILDTLVASRSDLEDFTAEALQSEAGFDPAEEVSEVSSAAEDIEADEVEETAVPPMNMLDRARAAVQDGDIDSAVEHYVSMINQKIELDSVVEDLRSAVNKTPDVPILWQTLGDALMQNGKITDAIDAYRRGMEAV
jgi:tetratricopeptide (TPR) repeat protein